MWGAIYPHSSVAYNGEKLETVYLSQSNDGQINYGLLNIMQPLKWPKISV